MGKKMLHI